MTPETLVLLSAPPTLAGRIIMHIRALELRVARLRMTLFGTGAVASVIATASALWYGTYVVINSAFGQYLSLVLSDAGSVSLFWRELLLSLLETFPALETLAVFIAVYILALTTLHAVRYSLLVTQLEKPTPYANAH